MTSLTGLAVILSIGIGIGISYWYVKKKSKRLVKQAMDILNSNNGKIPSIHKKFDTFESEDGDVHEQPPKKEGEKIKEDSATAESAPSSNIKEKIIKPSQLDRVEVKKKK